MKLSLLLQHTCKLLSFLRQQIGVWQVMEAVYHYVCARAWEMRLVVLLGAHSIIILIFVLLCSCDLAEQQDTEG